LAAVEKGWVTLIGATTENPSFEVIPALGNTFQELYLGISGNNLWIIHKNLPDADPEAGLSSGNLQGFQSGPLPTTRTFAFNLKVKF
uniref:hypothetical protein n=1 Tax=Flavobacterium sp. TaxID=239 RepID=UPI004048B6E3